MEVNGKEFMRNVGIEQDKERLVQEQKRLEALKREAYLREEENAKSQNPDEAAFIDLSLNSSAPSNMMNEQTIEDLKLEQEDPLKTKKKYILLGIALILIFVITILVIRIISNSDTEEKMENLNPQQQELTTDKILDKIDTNEEYQKAIDQNLAKEEQKKIDEAKKSAVPNVGLEDEKVENTPLVIEKPKPQEPPKKDLFGLNEANEPIENVPEKVVKTPVEPKKAIDNIYKNIEETEQASVTQKTVSTLSSKTKKVSSVTPAKETKLTKTVTKPATQQATQKVSGYYIQVGAFTKQPSKQLLDEITSKGFSYVVHPMVIKGTKYNKVLIGAYPTKQTAQNDLNNVKQKLKKSGAYILKF